MTERAAVLQGIQFGVESSPGSLAAANRLLRNIETFGIHVMPTATMRRAAGTKFAALSTPGTEHVEASVEGQLDYSLLTYILDSALLAASPTGPNADGAYTRIWTPTRAAIDTPRTYTVEHGDGVRAGRFTYGFFSGVTLTINPNETRFAGTMIGKGYTDGVSLTGSPTSPEYVQSPPFHWKLYLDATPGGIGGTQLTRGFSAVLPFTDNYSPLYVVDSTAARGFSAHVQNAPTAQLQLTVEADTVGMGLLTDIRAGNIKYARLEAVGPAIAGSSTYKATIDVALALTDMGELSDEQGALAIQWTGDMAWDTTLTEALKITLINALAAV